MDESDLAGLTHSFVIPKSPRPKQFRTLSDIVEEPDVEQQAAACCASSTLAWVTMDDDEILFVG